MSAVLLVCAFGALTFVEQPFDDVQIGDSDPLTGVTDVNFRHADLNGDGAIDLLTPTFVHFLSASEPVKSVPLPLPAVTDRCVCDVWGADLYLLTQSKLRVLRWTGQDWSELHTQSNEWKIDYASIRLRPSIDESTPRARFEQFLHDLNGDDVPEIVLPSEEGLAIFSRSNGSFVVAGLLDAFPRLQIATPQRENLWPAGQRHLSFPARRMSCRYYFDEATLTIVADEMLSNCQIRYHISSYAVQTSANGFVIDKSHGQIMQSPVMPSHVMPCRLNDDASIDFAGGDWAWSKSSAAPAGVASRPLFDTIASTDGGTRFHRVRSVSFRPSCLFVDFEGDGDLDMVTESMPVLESGAKESIAQRISSTKLDHRLEVRLQDDSGDFSEQPSLTHAFTFHFERAPIIWNALFNNYLAGELVDLTGDFNGDRLKDLALHVRESELAICLAESNGNVEGAYKLESSPALRLKLVPGESFAVADVDGDGLSDVQLSRAADSEGASQVIRRTFLMRRTAQ